MFPGQGAQYVGMGKELAARFPEAAEVFERANAVLGFDLRKICFEGPDAELVQTRNSQPALLVTSIACWKVLQKHLPQLNIVGCAGLSLGEITALHVAGALSFERALKLVRERGAAMQEACDNNPGGMASLMGLEEASVRQLCGAIVSENKGWVLQPANVNCPGQIVVSGHKEAVAAGVERVSGMEGARAIPLTVSGAFHSPLMQSGADRLKKYLTQITFSMPRMPVCSNVTGGQIPTAQAIADLLMRQVTSPVLWDACVRSLLALKPDLFLELGSGRVLCGLLRKIDKTAKSCNIEDIASLEKTLKEVGHDA